MLVQVDQRATTPPWNIHSWLPVPMDWATWKQPHLVASAAPSASRPPRPDTPRGLTPGGLHNPNRYEVTLSSCHRGRAPGDTWAVCR